MVNGVSLWRGTKKGKTFAYQDKIIKNYIERSGTLFYVHRYIGPEGKENTNELSIQDITVLENRDRKYDTTIIDLIGCYQIQEAAFDLSQFGSYVSGDIIYLEFSLNDHIEKLGRRLMTGDVLEPVHLRDEYALDQGSDPIPKFYVVQEGTRPVSGYGSTWFPHIWRTKCTPVSDSQEYRNILHTPNKKIDTSLSWQDAFGVQTVTGSGVDNTNPNANDGAGSASTLNSEVAVARQITKEAAEQVKKRGFFIRHFYMRPGNQVVRDGLISWLMNDDNTPPNWTGDFIPSGDNFPTSPSDGDYFIRTDYDPESLFLRQEGSWRMMQQNWRAEWTPAGRILESYIRNSNITVVDSTDTGTFRERQTLADVILPRADYLPDVRKDGNPKGKIED